MLRLKVGAGAIDIPVEIHAPEHGAEGGWFCRYTIRWPDEPWSSAGWGEDAVQALYLTLSKIGIELYASDEHKAGRLMWAEWGSGYGFPVPPNGRDQLIGEDARFF